MINRSNLSIDRGSLLSAGSGVGPASYLNLPGASGDYASTPDSVPVSITGDLSIMVRVAATDWTPAGQMSFVAKVDVVASSFSYDFALGAAGNSGKLIANISTDGTAPASKVSTVANAFTDGTTNWVLMTIDVDNGAAGWDAKFYTAADSATPPAFASFTQLGTTVTTATAISIFDSTSVVEIGARALGTATRFIGKIFRARIYAGLVDVGTEVLKAEFNAADGLVGASSLTSSTTGEVWTINGAASLQ